MPHIKRAALRSLAIAGVAASVAWVFSLLVPERPLWLHLIAVGLIAAAATFPLQLTLSHLGTALRETQKELQNALRHEAVTTSPRPSEFADTVERATDRRHVGTVESQDGIMLALKVDNFDEIGRRYGPQWADTLLLSIIQIVYSSVRYGDLVARLASDELGIYLPGATTENASDICERIRIRIREATFSAGQDRHIDVTVRLGGTRIGHQADFQVIREAANRAAHAEEEAGSILFRERFS